MFYKHQFFREDLSGMCISQCVYWCLLHVCFLSCVASMKRQIHLLHHYCDSIFCKWLFSCKNWLCVILLILSNVIDSASQKAAYLVSRIRGFGLAKVPAEILFAEWPHFHIPLRKMIPWGLRFIVAVLRKYAWNGWGQSDVLRNPQFMSVVLEWAQTLARNMC